VDLSGSRALVTGASSGVGIETARALRAGSEVVLGVERCRKQGNRRQDLGVDRQSGCQRRSARPCQPRRSIREFVDAWQGPLHMLVYNAGLWPHRSSSARRRVERCNSRSNFLGHFALTVGLDDALARAEGARVVSLSSNAHTHCPVVFDDLDYRFRIYNPIGVRRVQDC
jgi:NAD(P)-dependent dehydrogenase (short-subunit alcohol dehydrogenase family)